MNKHITKSTISKQKKQTNYGFLHINALNLIFCNHSLQTINKIIICTAVKSPKFRQRNVILAKRSKM